MLTSASTRGYSCLRQVKISDERRRRCRLSHHLARISTQTSLWPAKSTRVEKNNALLPSTTKLVLEDLLLAQFSIHLDGQHGLILRVLAWPALAPLCV